MVTPEFGKLFIFNRLISAIEFRDMYYGYKDYPIFEVEAEDLSHLLTCSASVGTNEFLFKQFWEGNIANACDSPYGTLGRSKVKLIKQVIL